ncbi:MAG: aldo/keto reductase [Chloroflexi bacterium]|nr:aldo/keto reductase [Chloroflexota bacterium]
MEYRTLGRTGVQVSCLCMGTMSFGAEADEETSAAMFHRCRELGINFFDTANVYAGGRSEEILGRLIRDCREEIVLASKVYFPVGEDVNARGLSRRHIMLAVEASLKRLGTDWIDVYYVHHDDPGTPMEETLRALDDLVRQGKILYPAVSNWAAWQIAKALGISEREGLAKFVCIQPMYNLVKRQAEVEILPLAQSEQLGVVPYSPLGGGLLTGKYGTKQRPKQGRLVENPMYQKRYGDPIYYEIAERFVAHARERGVHPVSLAVAWVMSHPAVTAPIIGARNLEQLEPSLKALEVPMTPEWRAEISALSIEPPPATDRTEEKSQAS